MPKHSNLILTLEDESLASRLELSLLLALGFEVENGSSWGNLHLELFSAALSNRNFDLVSGLVNHFVCQ